MECENKYENGKIYKIVDNTNGDIYIGSTIQTLKKDYMPIRHHLDYIMKIKLIAQQTHILFY